MGDLKHIDDWEVEDHLRFIRRGSPQAPNSQRGRYPQVDDPDRVPSHQELADKGHKKPPPERPKAREPEFSSMDEAYEKLYGGLKRKKKELQQVEDKLKALMQLNTNTLPGMNRVQSARHLTEKIGRLQLEIAEAEGRPAPPPPTVPDLDDEAA